MTTQQRTGNFDAAEALAAHGVSTVEDDTAGLTEVVISNAATASDWLRAEMGRNALACLFRRGADIVHTPRIGEDGYKSLPERDLKKGASNGPAQIRAVLAQHVQALVNVRYDIVREKVDAESGEKKKAPALFPTGSANAAFNAAVIGEGTPNIRDLNGVTHTPILRPDGTVLETPGYDEATGMLYLPDNGLMVPPIPDRPTSEQLTEAVQFVLKPIAEFPFVSPRHRANWFAMTITPLLRTVLPPAYPFFVVSAKQPGSGKTLIVKLPGIVHGIVIRPELPADKEEQRKLIGSILSDTTAPLALFDNLTGVVRSSVLEGTVTSDTYSDRPLGATRIVTLPNDRVWVGTGNNVKVGGDLARRTYDIVIEPKGADPYLRTGFTIPDLERWMAQHRGQYLAALLTIARGWALAGFPSKESRSDSFGKWDGAMRGLVEWAQLGTEFGQDRENGVGAVSEDDADWATFIIEVHRVLGDEPFLAKDVIALIGDQVSQSAPRVSPESLPTELAEKWSKSPATVAKSLGRWLSNREGRYAEGYVVVLDSVVARAKRYRVVAPE